MRAVFGFVALVACSGQPEPAGVVAATRPVAAAPAPVADVRFYTRTTADLDGDGTVERAAGGFATRGGRRRAAVFVERRDGAEWRPVTDGGWLGGGGGNGSTVSDIEIADLDGDGLPELIALGRVGSKASGASARLVVLALRDGALHELAKVEWNAATYTHGTDVVIDGGTIRTLGVEFDGRAEHPFTRTWAFAGGQLSLR